MFDQARPRVGLVGSRKASRRALDLAHALGTAAAKQQVQVLSGGALGVDAAAHKGALSGGGVTFAVLACGVDRPYPSRNLPLFRDICRNQGGLVSPYEPGTPPLRHHFLFRNRLLAAWSDCVCVVEAAARSGALSTARAARAAGARLAAVPGSPGCDRLLLEGASLVERPRDLLAALDGEPRAFVLVRPEKGTTAGTLWDALSDPMEVDGLASQTGFTAAKIAAALARLELAGLVTRAPAGRYARAEAPSERTGEDAVA